MVISEASGNGVGEDGGGERRKRGTGHGIIFVAVTESKNGTFGKFAFNAGVEAVLLFPLEWDAILHGVAANDGVDDGVGAVGVTGKVTRQLSARPNV